MRLDYLDLSRFQLLQKHNKDASAAGKHQPVLLLRCCPSNRPPGQRSLKKRTHTFRRQQQTSDRRAPPLVGCGGSRSTPERKATASVVSKTGRWMERNSSTGARCLPLPTFSPKFRRGVASSGDKRRVRVREYAHAGSTTGRDGEKVVRKKQRTVGGERASFQFPDHNTLVTITLGSPSRNHVTLAFAGGACSECLQRSNYTARHLSTRS